MKTNSNIPNGLDISHHQDGINVDGVPSDFIICKASEGTSFTDNCFNKFIKKVRVTNKCFGLYHFANGKSSGKEEADFFLLKVKDYIGEAMLILDWEADALKKGPKYAKDFLDRVYEVTGVIPTIYMSKSVCREYDWTGVAGVNPLWMAQYANKEKTAYKTNPWTDNKGMGKFTSYIIHQYSSNGRLLGYGNNLDLNMCYISSDEWRALAKGNKIQKQYYPKYEETLVRCLNILDIDSSYEHRAKIAKANGMENYKGTVAENTLMLNLLKAGILVKE